MKKATVEPEMTVLDLPGHTIMNTLLLIIPEDCKQLCQPGEELKEAYFVAMHANGHNLFVAKDLNQDHRQVFPIYPAKENPLRNWKVKNYQTKP